MGPCSAAVLNSYNQPLNGVSVGPALIESQDRLQQHDCTIGAIAGRPSECGIYDVRHPQQSQIGTVPFPRYSSADGHLTCKYI